MTCTERPTLGLISEALYLPDRQVRGLAHNRTLNQTLLGGTCVQRRTLVLVRPSGMTNTTR
jgi:hypothetical protein